MQNQLFNKDHTKDYAKSPIYQFFKVSLHSSFSMLLFLELLSSSYFWELHRRYPILIIASLKFELPIRGRAIELEFFFFFSI